MVRIIILLLIHVIGDYFLQGPKLGKLKAFKIPYLVQHVGIYTLLFIVLSPIILGLTFIQGVGFSLLNGCFHFAIDYVTGKYKAKYFTTNEPKYLMTIGIDHTLHLLILIISYMCLFPQALYTFSNAFK